MQRTFIAFFWLALTGLATSAQAGPDRISIMLGSEHVNGSGFEEVNPGVFLTWTKAAFDERVDVTAGAFRNSYGDGSLAFSLSKEFAGNEFWGVGGFAALAWYPGNGDQFEVAAGDIVPILGLQTRIGPTFVQFIPGGGGSVDATISFGLTFALDD